jgi:hypothetical protein
MDTNIRALPNLNILGVGGGAPPPLTDENIGNDQTLRQLAIAASLYLNDLERKAFPPEQG